MNKLQVPIQLANNIPERSHRFTAIQLMVLLPRLNLPGTLSLLSCFAWRYCASTIRVYSILRTMQRSCKAGLHIRLKLEGNEAALATHGIGYKVASEVLIASLHGRHNAIRQRFASVPQEWVLIRKPCRPRCPARPFQPSRRDCLRAICKEPTRMIIVPIIDAGADTHDFSLPNVVDPTCVK